MACRGRRGCAVGGGAVGCAAKSDRRTECLGTGIARPLSDMSRPRPSSRARRRRSYWRAASGARRSKCQQLSSATDDTESSAIQGNVSSSVGLGRGKRQRFRKNVSSSVEVDLGKRQRFRENVSKSVEVDLGKRHRFRGKCQQFSSSWLDKTSAIQEKCHR